jgi:hypothetical protein
MTKARNQMNRLKALFAKCNCETADCCGSKGPDLCEKHWRQVLGSTTANVSKAKSKMQADFDGMYNGSVQSTFELSVDTEAVTMSALVMRGVQAVDARARSKEARQLGAEVVSLRNRANETSKHMRQCGLTRPTYVRMVVISQRLQAIAQRVKELWKP